MPATYEAIECSGCRACIAERLPNGGITVRADGRVINLWFADGEIICARKFCRATTRVTTTGMAGQTVGSAVGARL